MTGAMTGATTGVATGAIGIGTGTIAGNATGSDGTPNGRTRSSRAAEVFQDLVGSLAPQLLYTLHRGAVLASDGAAGRPGLIAEGRLPAGVLAGSAHHDHREIIGRLHD